MKKSYSLVLIAGLLLSSLAISAPLSVSAEDDIQTVLSAQKGNRVTVKLISGDEITGTVGVVNRSIVHLGEMAGKEFYDAVVPVSSIQAVVIRTKE